MLKCPFRVVYEYQKPEKGHLLKCPFLGLFMNAKNLQKGHLLKCPLRVVYKCQKVEKGHLLKCPFGVVREGQKARKRTFVEVSFWGCS